MAGFNIGGLGGINLESITETVTSTITGSNNAQKYPGEPLYSPFPHQMTNMFSDIASSGVLGQTIGNGINTALGAFENVANVADFLAYYANLTANGGLFGQATNSKMYNLMKDYVVIYTESFEDMIGIGSSIKIPFYFIFFPNPQSIKFSYSHKNSILRTRNFAYPDLESNDESITIDGYMAGAMCPVINLNGKSFGGLIRPLRKFSFSYWMEHILRAVFLSNGWTYGRGRKSYYQIPDKDSRQTITIRDKVYEGHITSFTEREDASQPFLIPFSFGFEVYRVWKAPAMAYLFQQFSSVPVVNLTDILGGTFANFDSTLGREV